MKKEIENKLRRIKENIMAKEYPEGWVDIEKIKMDSFIENNNKTSAIKNALALKKILEEIDIFIEEEQLLAGSIECTFSGTYDLYESSYGRNIKELPKPMKEFWQNEEYAKRLSSILTDEEKLAVDETLCIGKRVLGHQIPDFEKVLKIGLAGLLGEVRESQIDWEKRMKQTSDTNSNGNCNRDYFEKNKKKISERLEFLKAMEITLNASVKFAERFSVLAQGLAKVEEKKGNFSRKEELLKLAEVCRRVPLKPAFNFYEACQSFWFIYVIMHIEQSVDPYAFSVGRLDQFLYPYFKQDMEKGLIDYEKAFEILSCLWLKFMVCRQAWAVSQNILLGGQDEEGRDAVNNLTYLCLDITKYLKIPQPSVAFRYHKDISDKTMNKILNLMQEGLGMPSIHNDESFIKSLISENISLRDARNYVIAGCQEPNIPGKENARTTGGKFNLLKCLELTLNNGYSVISGKKIGMQTGEIKAFNSFDKFYNAFLEQVEYAVSLMVSSHNKSDTLIAELRPTPFLSLLFEGCIKKGEDVRRSGTIYNSTGVLTHGLGSTADSLASVKKAAFDDKNFSLEELSQILKKNYNGSEDVRLYLQNKIPKYGNDDEYVDSIAKKVVLDFVNIISKQINAVGGKYRVGFNTPSTNVRYGLNTAATPDGRKRGETLSYGTGPMQGFNRKGYTATIKSIDCFPHYKATLGTDISMSLNKSLFLTSEGRNIIKSLIKTHFELGGHHIMFNVVDSKVLRAAQKNPEKYMDLIVRIHGFSSYFVGLCKDIQEDIISRVEAGL